MTSVVLKLIVAGEGGVGKTTILTRFLTRRFTDDTAMTIGVQFRIQEVERNGNRIKLAMWDLGGQDRFRFILPQYCEGAVGAFLLFDTSDLSTLENLDEWIEILKKRTLGLPILLVGTKNDRLSIEERTRVDEIARKMAEERGFLGYFSTSSKTGENVDEAIYYVVDHAFPGMTTKACSTSIA